MEWLQTKNFDFKVKEDWARRYFEENVHYQIVRFRDKEPVYNSFEEWYEDFGYDCGLSVFNAAKRDGAIVDVRN